MYPALHGDICSSVRQDVLIRETGPDAQQEEDDGRKQLPVRQTVMELPVADALCPVRHQGSDGI